MGEKPFAGQLGEAICWSTQLLQPCSLRSVASGGRGADAVYSLKTACAQGFSFTLRSSKSRGIGAPVII